MAYEVITDPAKLPKALRPWADRGVIYPVPADMVPRNLPPDVPPEALVALMSNPSGEPEGVPMVYVRSSFFTPGPNTEESLLVFFFHKCAYCHTPFAMGYLPPGARILVKCKKHHCKKFTVVVAE